MRRHHTPLATLSLAFLVLGACGGSGDEATSPVSASGGAAGAGAGASAGKGGGGQAGAGAAGKAGGAGQAGQAGAAGQAGQAGAAGKAGAAGQAVGGAAGASGGGGSAATPCAIDADCTGFVPETSPPGCARGVCDPGPKTCRFVARDKDADGHTAKTCLSKLAGVIIVVGDDCDDSDPDTKPAGWDGPKGDGHPDRCGDGVDQDCNGKADDGALADGTTCTCAPGDVRACSEDSSGKPISWPTGAPKGECEYGSQTCQQNGSWGPCTDARQPTGEACDGKDNDCDGLTDESDAINRVYWWWDGDNDYHAAKGYLPVLACSPPTTPPAECASCKVTPSAWKQSLVDDDCDDTDASRRPGQTEVCDGKDNDCNGSIDDNVSGVATWTFDEDGDGHALPVPKTLKQCAQPGTTAPECFGLTVPCSSHWTTTPITQQDCDDADAARYPGNWDGPVTTQVGLEAPWSVALFGRNLLNYSAAPSATEQPSKTTTAHTLDWSWGTSTPFPGSSKDYFVLRATGTVLVADAGTYTFTATAGDGVRVYVDGALVVDHWSNSTTPVATSADATLAVGPHDVQVDYYEYTGSGSLLVEWAGPTFTKRPLATHDDSSYGTRADACDGKDNDCSLTPDDGLSTAAGAVRRCVAPACLAGAIAVCGGLNAAGAANVGVCRTGVKTCGLDGAWGSCVGSVEMSKRDCSSSSDKDCDGKADNTMDGVCTCKAGDVAACDTHPGLDGVGVCKAGSQTCVTSGGGTVWGACSGSVDPGTDTCDPSKDLDCDGVVGNGSASCKKQINMNATNSFSAQASSCLAPNDSNGTSGTANSKTWAFTYAAAASGPGLVEMNRCTNPAGTLHTMVIGGNLACPSGWSGVRVGYVGTNSPPGWLPVVQYKLPGGLVGFCSGVGCLLPALAGLNGCNWGTRSDTIYFAPPP